FVGWTGQAEAIAGHDTRGRLASLHVPTLITTGIEDIRTTVGLRGAPCPDRWLRAQAHSRRWPHALHRAGLRLQRGLPGISPQALRLGHSEGASPPFRTSPEDWVARTKPALGAGTGALPCPRRQAPPRLARRALLRQRGLSESFTASSRSRCCVAGLRRAAKAAGSVRARSRAWSIFCVSPPVFCTSSLSTCPASA